LTTPKASSNVWKRRPIFFWAPRLAQQGHVSPDHTQEQI
jgi:hypothetical protein